ncbi:heterokaryon incompatibility protein-domain-containing protein [Immersiella caudata]|uniref:Heterokaryon incompatibility protein-domain-containing protein n=1 Tax=Immersiella caudata TaxID=314043 RepID=A0AA39X000_9PEZI|nr:heterokaryon incompatibility protein-domain-containing protein [Immersiella caudata]
MMRLSAAHCRLSLPESPLYDVLSYIWGATDATKGIVVDGRRLEVTVSLESALRRLRCDEPRQLWVDAVCIDRNNEEEKRRNNP